MNAKAEKKAETAPATEAAPTKAKFVPKVIRKVVLPQLKQAANETVYWQFITAIVSKPKIEMVKQDDGTTKEVHKTIDVAQVVALDTCEIGQVVIGDVLKKNLCEAYPNDGYVNKGFEITKKDVPGKRYKGYLINEIEV